MTDEGALPSLPQPDPYWRQRIALLMVAAAVGAWYWQSSRVKPIAPLLTASARTAPVDWFLILRMPAVTSQYESGVDTMRVRYGEWLEALNRAGFHPMTFSELHRRLENTAGVPEKTVVLVFDPGFRRSYKIVAPILERCRWPAVWLSNGPAMKRGHREYVTYHDARRMVKSGWWDVGYSDEEGSFTLDTQEGKIQLGSKRDGLWSPTTGGVALNRTKELHLLHRLNVNSDWTAQDLVNRLLVEVPIEGQAYLTKGQVQNLVWGISLKTAVPGQASYDLHVPSYRRGIRLDWLGTRDQPDFKLDTQMKSLVGQFWLRLRWDETRAEGLSVVISNKALIVEREMHGHSQSLLRLARRNPALPPAVNLSLIKDHLTITLDQGIPQNVTVPLPAAESHGLIQLYLFDALKGSARADSVRMIYSQI